MKLETFIDHTYLKADGTQEIITRLCQEAKAYQFKAVCVNPTWVSLAANLLQDSGVEVATVVGFPLGATTTVAKTAEASQAVSDGATEIDMVINLGYLLDGDYDSVKKDIIAVVNAANQVPVKVIIETALLNDGQKRKACQLAQEAGAAFVKTSTGFSTAGASVEDIILMRSVVGKYMGVKASGGVRNAQQAKAMIAAGASRIGTSSGIKIVTEQHESE